MKSTTTFRFMEMEDIDQILHIERLSFTVPWSREAFYNELTHNQYARYIVLEEEGQILGYCGLWIVMDEAHITNIALLPEYRGKGLGTELLRKAMTETKELGAKTMSLEVRESNHVAQSLYRKLGFENGGIRKNYYSDNQEDALVMWVRL